MANNGNRAAHASFSNLAGSSLGVAGSIVSGKVASQAAATGYKLAAATVDAKEASNLPKAMMSRPKRV